MYILEKGRTKRIYDLFITWLQKATHRFIWLWPSLRGAQVFPFLVTWVESTCHWRQDCTFALPRAADAMRILRRLSQDQSYGNDILGTKSCKLLTISDKTRLMQMLRSGRGNAIRLLAQEIQFLVIDCSKFITIPRPESNPPHTEERLTVKTGWNNMELASPNDASPAAASGRRPLGDTTGSTQIRASHSPPTHTPRTLHDNPPTSAGVVPTRPRCSARLICPPHLCPTLRY